MLHLTAPWSPLPLLLICAAVEPSSLRLATVLLSGVAHSCSLARSVRQWRCPPPKARPLPPSLLHALSPLCLAPPLLDLHVTVPSGGEVNVCLGCGLTQVAGLRLGGGVLVRLRGGRGPVAVTARLQDVSIDDSLGKPTCGSLGSSILRRKKRRRQSDEPPPPMLVVDLESGALLLRAVDWRFVYLQRVTMEVLALVKDMDIPAVTQPLAQCRARDLLASTVLHHLATATCPLLPYTTGLPPPPPSTCGPPLCLRVLLLSCRVVLPERSVSPSDALVADISSFKMYKLRPQPTPSHNAQVTEGARANEGTSPFSSTQGGH